ncbi:MAG TPA: metallophosphoesterase [Candidatus Limnocylindria bacterium]
MSPSPRSTRNYLLVAVAGILIGVLVAFALRPILGAPQPTPGLGLPSNLESLVQPTEEPSGSPDEPEVLMAVGDIGSCNVTSDDAVAELIKSIGGTVALIGDLAYEAGSDQEFQDCFNPSWGAMKSRMHPALGNHEYNTPGAAGYFDYFGSSAGTPGEGWYSYDLGGWHIVVLNANCGDISCRKNSAQIQWLRQDLATAGASCLMAYWHQPRWSSGKHGSQAYVQPFWDVLEPAGVDVILNGHDHDYERIEVDGVRQFVVGTGGRSLYTFPGPALPTTVVRSDKAYGALWMELSPGSYRWNFLSLGDSGFKDSGTGTC